MGSPYSAFLFFESRSPLLLFKANQFSITMYSHPNDLITAYRLHKRVLITVLFYYIIHQNKLIHSDSMISHQLISQVRFLLISTSFLGKLR
jgi:hypothetical protein